MNNGVTDEEFDRYASIADRCIRGEHVTVVCRNNGECKFEFDMCRRAFDEIGLAYRARSSLITHEIIVGESLMRGGVDFRTMWQERSGCGDHRDR